MITHTETFETLASAPIKQTDTIVVRQTVDPYGYYDDNTAKWTSSTILMSVNIDSIGTFLGTTTKKAVVKLLGIVSGVSADELFQIRYGLYDDDLDAYEYISEGFYLVDNITFDYEAGSTTITMYDYMWKAQQTSYNNATSYFSYPTTVYGLAEQVVDALGIDLMSDFDTLPNYDFAIDEDLYATISNVTLQSIIQEIAGATGTTARISDNTLVFSQYRLTNGADS